MNPLFAPIIGIIGKVVDRVIPDPVKSAEVKLKVAELEQAGELAFLDADLKIALAQASINLEEAKSDSLFKSGWRPAVAWVCGAGFLWSVVVQPILVFAFSALGHPLKELPAIDTGLLMTMLGGLLGLGGMRSFEKKHGVAGK